MQPELRGELQLAAHAIGGGDEHGVGIALGVQSEEPGEATDLGEHLFVEGAAGQPLDAVVGEQTPVGRDEAAGQVRRFTGGRCDVLDG